MQWQEESDRCVVRIIPLALGWLSTSPIACLMRSRVGWNSRLMASVLSRSMPCDDQQISRLPCLRITASTLPLCSAAFTNVHDWQTRAKNARPRPKLKSGYKNCIFWSFLQKWADPVWRRIVAGWLCPFCMQFLWCNLDISQSHSTK